MRKIMTVLLLALSFNGFAQETSEQEITKTLHWFMEGASVNSAAVHEGFWADELVYTSSSGKRFGKSELMDGVRSGGEITDDPLTNYYTAEDIQIAFYGETAVVNFTLVSHTDNNAGYSRETFLNSGVFIQRDGHWQAVNWNATRTASN